MIEELMKGELVCCMSYSEESGADISSWQTVHMHKPLPHECGEVLYVWPDKVEIKFYPKNTYGRRCEKTTIWPRAHVDKADRVEAMDFRLSKVEAWISDEELGDHNG